MKMTIDFVNDSIDRMIERFKNDDGRSIYVCRQIVEVEYYEDDCYKLPFLIEEEIEMMLSGFNIDHNVELVELGERFWVVGIWFRVGEETQTRNFVVQNPDFWEEM